MLTLSSVAELKAIDTRAECAIVKGFFSPDKCDRILGKLQEIGRLFRSHQKFWGGNIYRDLLTLGAFRSYRFFNLAAPELMLIAEAYDAIRRAYELIDGPKGPFTDFDPLVLWYPAGSGHFRRHRHNNEAQPCQLVVNLARPGIDYNGGHTIVEAPGHPEVFDARLKQGDLMAFPFDRHHEVEMVLPGAQGSLQSRVSMVMAYQGGY